MNVYVAWLLAITVITTGMVLMLYLILKYEAIRQQREHDHEILKD